MRKGDIGASVGALQRHLVDKGLPLDINAIFDDATELAVTEFQRRTGLVADGIVGPKTLQALVSGERDGKLLGETDLEATAAQLGVPLAAIKAVNEVETRGRGFLDDGRPVILYERHVAFAKIEDLLDETEALALSAMYPNIINPKRGGYAGNEAEWARLARAQQALASRALDADLAGESCSWGQFQIMGYHWQALGYASFGEFRDAMCRSEADQLDAFVRFIQQDPALHRALKGRKWAEFARIYNGPAYKDNFYDAKLARAFARHAAGAPA